MSGGAREVEKAVSRTVRDTLDALQRTSESLNQALNDLVAACGSSRPANALPPILRAQTAAASLAASLEVLSKFVAGSILPMPASALVTDEAEAPEPPVRVATPPQPKAEAAAVTEPRVEPAAETAPPPGFEPIPDMGEDLSPVQEPVPNELPGVDGNASLDSNAAQTISQLSASELADQPPAIVADNSPVSASPPADGIEEMPPEEAAFDLSVLAPEQQDLHRRANRVAKVSMQDIKMLRPNEVRLGRENRDICFRLRDDIEKAHKEYDRRFQSILGHPVDYFYDWMVEILGDGDPAALGEYPYPSPVPRR